LIVLKFRFYNRNKDNTIDSDSNKIFYYIYGFIKPYNSFFW